MQLQDLDIIVTASPAPSWGGRYWILVKLTTSNGIVGWGECYASSVGPDAMRAVISDVFERHMQGENPENIERMFRRAYSSGFTGRPDLTVMGAFSGLEIACWDILGKAAEKPCWSLLGGCTNEKVRAYTYLYPLPQHSLDAFWTSPQFGAEAAADCAERGYTAVKFDPAGPYTMRGGHMPAGSDVEQSVAFCSAIREAVGNNVDLLFGTHGQCSTAGSIRLAKAIEPFDPLWYEEPVGPDNDSEMAKVAKSTSIPIATGERLCTKNEFASVLRSGAATILQPALGRAGGIWEAKKISVIAETYNAPDGPASLCGAHRMGRQHTAGCLHSQLLICETIETDFHRDLIKSSIAVSEGFCIGAYRTRFGNRRRRKSRASSPPISGDGLHLQMQEAPCDYVNGNSFAGGGSD